MRAVKTLLQQFEDQVARRAAAPALTDGTATLSYAELNSRANRLAHALLERRVAPGALIGLHCEPSLEQIVGMLAILKAGCAWVPLDPAYPRERLQSIAVTAQLSAVLYSRAESDVATTLAPHSWCIDELIAAGIAATNPGLPVQAADLCYVMFTSGTTGTPSGVMVNHGNVAGLFTALAEELQFTPDDRWSALHSPAFGFSVWETWGPLATGGCLVIVAPAMRADPAQWVAQLTAQRVAVLSITPSGFRQLLAADCLPAKLASLRLVVFSGEAVRPDDIDCWFERYPDQGPRLINTYALTETAGRVCALEYRAGKTLTPGSIGRPVSDAEVFVENGELLIAGPMVTPGYLNDAELTAERFVLRDGRRCYRSGDRANVTADGEIVFLGRADDQVKLRGHRIELQDIENCLRAHPGVADAAVVVQSATETQQLAAFVVRQAADDNELQFWPSLGEYQVYDDLLYDFMAADEVRVASYRRAFERCVKDKTVLDIGTGKDALLARLCIAAGARKVYAVEVLAQAAAQARELVSELGLADRIEVLTGDMQSLSIPEPVEVCTQGIVGNIGSSDGIAPIWNAARQHFAADAVAVPAVCTTLFAPAELPSGVRDNAAFGPLAAEYARRIFAEQGGEFDIRLCVRNFPAAGMLAAPAEFERLDFAGPLPTAYEGEQSFVVERDGCFDGVLLWTTIQTDQTESVDFFAHQQAWLPVWLPLSDASLPVHKGDRLQVRWQCTTPAGQVFPDYELAVTLQNDANELRYTTRHFDTARGQTALHRQLLGSLDRTELDDWLREQLPAHMVPARIVELPRLPVNANGKLDKQQLRGYSIPVPVTLEEGDALEQALMRIWCGVLDRPGLSLDDDFFDAGGDSILAVRLTTEVQRCLDATVFLATLFDAPTVRTYARKLVEQHPDAVARLIGAPSIEELTPQREPGAAPLSWPQQSLWFLDQLYPGHTGANEQFLIRVAGAADEARLRAAWHALLDRHDILRTSFAPGTPVTQLVNEPGLCQERDPVPCIDLSAVPDAAEQLLAAAGEEIRTAFDLQQAPLLRAFLFRMPGNDHVLLVTAHHIIADGLCVELIRDELATTYQRGEGLLPPAYQYADFARAQPQSLTAARLAEGTGWWQRQLAGHSGQPGGGTRNEDGRGGSEVRQAFVVPVTTADALRRLAREHGATPFMLLLAAWRVWLGRCLLEKDLLIGSPVTLRRDERTAEMLGCLVNNVVFRNRLDPCLSFSELLRAERGAVLDAMAHSDIPFEKVVEAVQPERQLGRHPLFQILFLYEDRAARPAVADGLEFTADVLPVERASYWDLELSVADLGVGQALQAFIGVRRDAYDAAATNWWAEGFTAMLAAIVADPDTRINALPLLSTAQRQRVLVDWNATHQQIAPAATLHELFAAQAARTPASTAVVDEHETLTYAALAALAATYAAGLQARGVGVGDCVGVCTARGADTIALLIAIARAGAAWLPLDPGYPPQRLTAMIAAARPTLLVGAVSAETSAALGAGPRVVALDELAAADPEFFESPAVAGEDIAYVLFTSGSTGEPKGVLATHASAVSRCCWMWREYGFSDADVFGQRTSLNFIDSVWEIFGALAHGATINVLPVRHEYAADRVADWIARAGITHLVMVPSLLRGLLREYDVRSAPDALRIVITSGETLPPALVRDWFARFPEKRLLNTYGTSETWDVSCYEVQPDDARAGRVPVGRPVANASLCIFDEALQPVPPGVTGELYAGGLGLARAYVARPELTAERFVANPHVELDTSRLYRTGDLARFRADGTVELLGRADRQIKLRGLRIETGEIEALALARDDIAESLVVLRTEGDREWLVLYVVPAGCARDADTVFDVEVLRQYLAARLPRAMVPADICVLDAMPLTPNGKLDVAALPVSAAPTYADSYAPPRNTLERQLAAIWADALELEQVGVHDNFFALRGHSLLATRVVAQICEELQLDVPLQFIFDAPTVAGLARSIETLRWAAEPDAADAGEAREVFRL